MMVGNSPCYIAQALVDAGAIEVSHKKGFVLKSGIKSPLYIDVRKLIHSPRDWKQVLYAIRVCSMTRASQFNALAGVESGGVPHAAAVAYIDSVPLLFTNDNSTYAQGKRVLLIEDVVTTGGSVLEAVEALRLIGAVVSDVITIVFRGAKDVLRSFDNAGVSLHYLVTEEDVLKYININ